MSFRGGKLLRGRVNGKHLMPFWSEDPEPIILTGPKTLKWPLNNDKKDLCMACRVGAEIGIATGEKNLPSYSLRYKGRNFLNSVNF